MLDLWKSLIEHILSWPVFTLILCLIFRQPLTVLVGRISSIKAPGIDVSAPPPLASAQIDSKTLSPPEVLKGEIGSTSSDPISASPSMPSGVESVLQEKREAVRNLGKGNAIVAEDVERIKAQLAALNFPLDSADTGEILVRHLAATQLMVRFERTHRLIFGSQILALHLMNNEPQPDETLRAVFENARTKEPQFYRSYKFEDWIGFLIKEVTVVKTEHNSYAITVYGKNYLEYIGVFATTPKPH